MSASRSRASGASKFLLIAGLAALVLMPEVAIAGSPASRQIDAVYRITLNSLDIGHLRYRATVQGGAYEVASDVELSFLFKAFHWKGALHSAGSISGAALAPESYSFEFQGSKGVGRLLMEFDRMGRATVTAGPELVIHPDSIPLKHEHLSAVIDPISALFALSRGSAIDACSRKLAIFDGQQRFDLTLAFRRNDTVGGTRATICGVRYTPISGHRLTSDVRAMAAARDIEVALVSAESDGLMMPVAITVPISIGTLMLSAESVDLTSNVNRKLATFGGLRELSAAAREAQTQGTAR
jgi:hypothetical protein